jgi:hypothetical protein
VKRYRSSVTGRFVSKKWATAHPDRSVAEETSIVAALKARLAALLADRDVT